MINFTQMATAALPLIERRASALVSLYAPAANSRDLGARVITPTPAAKIGNKRSPMMEAKILKERVARLRAWGARTPLLPETPRRLLGEDQVALLEPAAFLLADRATLDPDNTDILILERGGIPPVLVDTQTGAWRCASSVVSGRSILSMTCWVRDCDPLASYAFLYVAHRTAHRWRP